MFRTLLRSTPVRQALGLVAVAGLVNLLTLGLAYLQIRDGIEDTLHANLAQNMAGFRIAATPAAIAALVRAEAEVADPAARVFVYIWPNGRTTGNAEARLDPDGLSILPRPGGRPLSAAGYLPQVERIAGGVLIVAESRAPLADLSRTFLRLLIFSLAPTVLISLGAGVLLARRSARRVARIEATLDQLGAGDLSARLPVPDREDDDFARIGRGVNRMAAAQEASVAALRQVSADIAHDLRTPMQRIAVLLSDLRERLPPDAPESTIAARARDEAERAVAVFRALLQIAQIEGGNTRARFTPVDLAALARTFTELYDPTAEEAGHRLLPDLPDTPVMVLGDRTLLGQALANLIENALRHTAPGPITISVETDAETATLTVRDTGPGIPPDERDKVLRRLYRLERSRTTPGHGLGLSLVAAIAELHGAELTLDDAEPGLRVSLRLPLYST